MVNHLLSWLSEFCCMESIFEHITAVTLDDIAYFVQCLFDLLLSFYDSTNIKYEMTPPNVKCCAFYPVLSIGYVFIDDLKLSWKSKYINSTFLQWLQSI